MFDTGKHTYKSDLNLGERYRDKTTGLEGHLVSLHFYEHACERGTIRYLNGQTDVAEATFDAPDFIHVPTGDPVKSKRTGGPDRGTGARSAVAR